LSENGKQKERDPRGPKLCHLVCDHILHVNIAPKTSPDSLRLLIYGQDMNQVLYLECRMQLEGYEIFATPDWAVARWVLLHQPIDVLALVDVQPRNTVLERLDWVREEGLSPLTFIFLDGGLSGSLEESRLLEHRVRPFLIPLSRAPRAHGLIATARRLPVRKSMQDLPIGRILTRLEAVDMESLERGLDIQRRQNPAQRCPLGLILVEQGFVNPAQLQKALSIQLGADSSVHSSITNC